MNSKFDAMGKMELRAACKASGIKYGKLDNAGMRAALVAFEEERNKLIDSGKGVTDAAETDTEEQAPMTGGFANIGLMLGGTPIAPPVIGKVTSVVDGKTVDPTAPKGKTATEKGERTPPAPRISRKGYTIDKDRPMQNGVKRPSAGTVCGAVWAAFDANPAIKAGELAALADANQWNRTNVSCEFYAWRKFNNISGRSK
jgi:hypothetical protein